MHIRALNERLTALSSQRNHVAGDVDSRAVQLDSQLDAVECKNSAGNEVAVLASIAAASRELRTDVDEIAHRVGEQGNSIVELRMHVVDVTTAVASFRGQL